MNWLDRYLAAIGERLPARQRQDILKELRSLLLDALDHQTEGQAEYAEEDILAVIRQFGSPEEVALRYAPKPRYIIGPQLYDTYLTVTQILLTLVAFGIGVALVVELVRADLSLLAVMGQTVARVLSAGVSVIGWTTLVFALIERTSAGKYEAEPEGSELDDDVGNAAGWDPKTLPAFVSGERVSISDQAFSLAVAVLALVGANYLAVQLGIYGSVSGELTPELQVVNKDTVALLLPWWNAMWIAGFAIDAAALIQRRWRTGLRIGAIAVDIGSAILLAVLASSQLLLGENIIALAGPEQADGLATAARIAPQALRGIFIAAMLFTVWDMIEQIMALVRVHRGRSDVSGSTGQLG